MIIFIITEVDDIRSYCVIFHKLLIILRHLTDQCTVITSKKNNIEEVGLIQL